MAADRPFIVRAAQRQDLPEHQVRHPLNPQARSSIRSLSTAVGLARLGVHVVTLPPGADANAEHTHTHEEEFYFVLSGEGVVRIDGEEFGVQAGDFIGFPAPSPPHMMTNRSDADLVFLAAGERGPFELAEFPAHGQTLIRSGGRGAIVASDQVQSLKELWSGKDS